MSKGKNSIAIIAITALVCTTGCRSSGWKMPGASLFSTNRQPDAATLVGSEVPELPESPAAKHSPGTIASVGAKTTDRSLAAGSTSASAYGYSASSTAPKTGLAAQSNGYQTGPYQVASSTASITNKSPAADAASTVNSATAGLPSPYGGTYAGSAVSTSSPDIALPSSVTNSLSAGSAVSPGTYPAATNGYGNGQSPSVQLPSAQASSGTNMLQNGLPVGFPSGGTQSATTGSSLGAMPQYPTSGSLPAYPSLPSSAGYPASTGGLGLGGTSTPASSAYQGSTTQPTNTPSSGYAPGTTGRKTNYNFGTNSSSSGSTKLPPNTASGNSLLLR